MAFSDSQANAVIDYGENEAEVTLASAAKVGDAIGWSSGWQRALGTTANVIAMRCVAGEDGATGQRIKVYFGKVGISGSRFSGGTAGAALYVAEGTDVGEYTETAPSDTGDSTTKVGYMISANEATLIPNRNVDSVA